MAVVVDKYFMVLMTEGNGHDPGVNIKNGDMLDIGVTGTVWSGVWATGRNGPAGWPGWSASNDALAPGQPPFSLLLHTAEDGYISIGTGLRRTYQNATLGPGETRLTFNINRDPVGRIGDGGFHVHLIVWR